MNNNYLISCESTCDLTSEHLKKIDVNYICYHFELDGVLYKDDFGESLPFSELYSRMINGSETKTAQINSNEFVEYFRPLLEQGKDIIHVCMSSGITGVLNSATMAAQMLKEEFPTQNIIIIDSLCISSGYGLLVDKMAELRDSGMSIDDLKKWVETNKLKVNHVFYSADLSFYVKGGRISKTSAFVGTMFNICPVLDINKDGKLVPRFKVRTKKKAIGAIVDKMVELADNGLDYDEKCYVCHSECLEDAKSVVSIIQSKFSKIKDIEIYNIGTTIGAHSGPNTCAIFFWGKERGE